MRGMESNGEGREKPENIGSVVAKERGNLETFPGSRRTPHPQKVMREIATLVIVGRSMGVARNVRSVGTIRTSRGSGRRHAEPRKHENSDVEGVGSLGKPGSSGQRRAKRQGASRWQHAGNRENPDAGKIEKAMCVAAALSRQCAGRQRHHEGEVRGFGRTGTSRALERRRTEPKGPYYSDARGFRRIITPEA